MFYTIFLAFLSLLLPADAWLPAKHKSTIARDSNNLFDSTPSYHRNNSRTQRSIPASGKIRGVNLGSLFVFEPWLAESTWSQMGCGGYASEFDCVSGIGQTKANTAFQSHWSSWITESDFTQMRSYGLNTVRIPIGYWMYEDIVYESEHFPQGGLTYLQQVCGLASDAGFYIILDLHGAPGAQVVKNPNTGQDAPTAGFYEPWQFERATTFLSWLTTQIHSNNNFRGVGMLEVVNEPVQSTIEAATMISIFYPAAYAAIRLAETTLNVAANNRLHVEFMSKLWWSGNPTTALSDATFTAYDDHRYLKWDSSVAVSQSSYMSASCNDNRNPDNETPTVVGEFSLSPPDDVENSAAWDPSTQQRFYKNWFAAQIQSYEKYTDGWVFWSWKSQLGDYRWSYQDAVAAGVIPAHLEDAIGASVCDGF